MRVNSSLTPGQRHEAIALFEQGRADHAVAAFLGVSRWAVRSLYRRWRIHGPGALVAKQAKKSYSFEFKVEAVRRLLAGEPKTELAQELELSSPKLLESWVRTYRTQGSEGLRPKQRGRPPKSPSQEPASELERLRRENEFLRAQNAYLGKVRALRKHPPE